MSRGSGESVQDRNLAELGVKEEQNSINGNPTTLRSLLPVPTVLVLL